MRSIWDILMAVWNAPINFDAFLRHQASFFPGELYLEAHIHVPAWVWVAIIIPALTVLVIRNRQ